MWGRIYFAAQAVAGAVWWLLVFLAPGIRVATLGELDPVPVALADIPLFVVGSALAALGVRSAVYIATGWTVVVMLGMSAYATVSGLAGWGALLMIGAVAGSVAATCLEVAGRIPSRWVAVGPFRFRPADARLSPSRHLVTTAAEIVVFWAVFFGALPLLIVLVEHRWRLAVSFSAVPLGVALFVLGGVLGLASAVLMATRGGGTPLPAAMPNRLVVAGPYRFVRNPMAVAGIVQGVAVGILLSSWLVVGYALAGALLWHVVVRPEEEADLEQRFGAEFRRYRREVLCWWPRVRPYTDDRS